MSWASKRLLGSMILCVSTVTPSLAQLAKAHYRAASEAFVKRQFDTAIEELRKSLALEPRQLGAIRLLGLTYQLKGQMELAGAQFERATQVAPKDGESWFYLGRIQYLQNFFDKALDALSTAVKYAPDDPRVRECLGLALEASGDTSGAEREFREAVRCMNRKPGFHTPLLNYGAFLLKQSRIDESESLLTRAVEAMPSNWQSRFELAKLHVQTDRFEPALKQLQAALGCERTDDESRRTQGLLTVVYGRLGREAEAAAAAAAAATQ